MCTIIGLGTYALGGATHGGVRRIRAIRAAYEGAGITYCHIAAVGAPSGGTAVAADGDLAIAVSPPQLPHAALMEDLLAGLAAASDEAAYSRIRAFITKRRPLAIALEQPFLYPVWQRLRRDGVVMNPRLIYSSQNLEATLRQSIVDRLALRSAFLDRCLTWMADMERRCLAEADLVISVSANEASVFTALTTAPITIAPNGIDPPRPQPERVRAWRERLPGGFAVTVGSEHPPNVHGFIETVVEGGMPYLPPRPAIVVCGGMARGLAANARYRQYGQTAESRIIGVPELDDGELASVIEASRAVFVPITYGGGTNLKTAEAIASKRPVLATSQGARGYERFLGLRGFHVADSRSAFRRSLRTLLDDPPFNHSPEECAFCDTVLWTQALSGLAPAIHRLLAS